MRTTLSLALLTGGLLFAHPAWAQEAAAESVWSIDLIASVFALSLGGGAAILGMWLTRDKKRPIAFALAMTTLIGTAVFVGITQSYLDAVDAIKKKEDLVRMMDMVKEIAVNTGDHELAALIEAEGGGAVEIVDIPEEDTDVPEGDTDTPEGEDAEGGEEAVEGEEGEEATDAEAPADGEAAPAGE